MPKQAPTKGRLAAMVLFALSCFGLLLFLWVSFGGTTPLKPKGYRFEAAFPEAAQLGVEADVRVAGVRVGRVREKRQDAKDPNRTVATLEIEPRYAPVPRDARAVLRTKTLLGETYVELQLGSKDADKLGEGDRLATRQVPETTQLDELLGTFDEPTRMAFRTWQRELGTGVRDRGGDLNDALGTLPAFAAEGRDLLQVLDEQRASLRGLVRNTGVTFQALSRREDQLQDLLRNTDTVFTAIQRQRESWAATWRIMPTFLDESRATFRRLERFAQDTEPLLVDLEPAVRDLGPTLRDVGVLAPDLQRLFRRLDPLIRASERSLPASREIFDGLRPFLGEVGPWVTQLNPLLDWIAQHQQSLADMFAGLGAATAATTGSGDPKSTGHYLRQIGPVGAETVAIWRNRLGTNRGNAYINPAELTSPETQRTGAIPSWDCANASGGPPCRVQEAFPYRGKTEQFPRLQATPTP